jgi:hypothetical protein
MKYLTVKEQMTNMEGLQISGSKRIEYVIIHDPEL